MSSRLRLSVMATHREEELVEASHTLGAVARSLGIAPRRHAAHAGAPHAALAQMQVFDFEAPEPARRAA
jgi:hypothetical protein